MNHHPFKSSWFPSQTRVLNCTWCYLEVCFDGKWIRKNASPLSPRNRIARHETRPAAPMNIVILDYSSMPIDDLQGDESSHVKTRRRPSIFLVVSIIFCSNSIRFRNEEHALLEHSTGQKVVLICLLSNFLSTPVLMLMVLGSDLDG